MRLGCLLGEYGGYMSFEPFSSDVGSWFTGAKLPFTLPQLLINPGSASSLETATHSSNVGMSIDTTSSTGDYIWSYNLQSDITDKGFPDITTHRLALSFWANQDSGTDTKYIRATINTSEAVGDISSYASINSYGAMTQHWVDEVNVTSNANNQLAFYTVQSGGVDPGCSALFLDDIWATVDMIELCPNFNASINREINFSPEQTLTGRYIDFSYGTREKFGLDFSVMDEVEAEIINRWWFKQYNLLFTFDTSDTNTNFICRIVNSTRPFSQVRKPYVNKFKGRLELEAINNGGWF